MMIMILSYVLENKTKKKISFGNNKKSLKLHHHENGSLKGPNIKIK